jgi:hypothetical protein
MDAQNETGRAQLEQLVSEQIESFVGRTMPNFVGDLRPYFQPLAKQIEAAIHGAFAIRAETAESTGGRGGED